MERGDASDAERTALDLIRDIREIDASPAVSAKLDALARALNLPERPNQRSGGSRPRRQFGAFKGRFSLGPEFFEPLSEQERRSWGEE